MGFDHFGKGFKGGAVSNCLFDHIFALRHTAFACKIKHICGKNHTHLGEVRRAVAFEGFNGFNHFKAVAYVCAKRSVHISDEGKHLFACALAYVHHDLCKTDAFFNRLCKCATACLDVKDYAVIVCCQLFAHNAGHYERQTVHCCSDVTEGVQLFVCRGKFVRLTYDCHTQIVDD